MRKILEQQIFMVQLKKGSFFIPISWLCSKTKGCTEMFKMSGNTQKYIALGLVSSMKEASVQVNFGNSVYTK